MLKLKFIFFIIIISFSQIFSQEGLYIPLNIQKAIENETRTTQGLPGDKYWQNSSDYSITAEILDSSNLKGDEVINYHNNSPDSLNQIVIRLYQDIAKKGAVRDWYIGNNFGEGVTINYIIVNADTIDVSSTSKEIVRGSTNLTVKLRNKIPPLSNTEIKIGWKFKIPDKLKIRMGNYGNGNMYVAYWYPEIAVYDDIDGWDRIDYSGMVEFYNDFSNFDVTIKVPKGTIVWATGDLVNAKEVLRKDIYNRYEKAKSSDEIVNIITQKDYEQGLVTAENKINEWKFNAKWVTSFAFATSTEFNWDGASAVVDRETGRRALTDVVYKKGSMHYDQGSKYAKETIEYLSETFPGFPYPYSHATSYCNGSLGGGMESPMMANDGAPKELGRHIGLIFHELSHNYFPFIMGTNERKYAWMDEGWASFLPTDLVKKYTPNYGYVEQYVKSYSSLAGSEYDLPIVTPSFSYKTKLMRLGFYSKPALSYFELRNLLGKDLFKKAILEYMNRWHGKHPIPIDFFNTINSVANEDLSWFWTPWFYEFGYPDLVLKSVKQSDDKLTIVVNKKGKIPTRIYIGIEFIDGTTQEVNYTARVWKDGNKEYLIDVPINKEVGKVVLGNKTIPDIDKGNNVFEF